MPLIERLVLRAVEPLNSGIFSSLDIRIELGNHSRYFAINHCTNET